MHWVSQTVSSAEKNYEGAGHQGSGGELCTVVLEMMIGIECLYEVLVFQFTPPSYALCFIRAIAFWRSRYDLKF